MSTVIIAEVGINHNGSLETAMRLIDAAKAAGADAVKFQKREPRISVPKAQWDKPKETPWGMMPYIEYKERMEFSLADYRDIASYCHEVKMPWFVSVWDGLSVEFARNFDMPYIKIPSAMALNRPLIEAAMYGPRLLVSTGMCEMRDVEGIVDQVEGSGAVLMHCTSTYPCPPEEINLRVIPAMRKRFPLEVGYSGHETGLIPSVAAVSLGATFIERHITLDRSMWGTDQAASVEPDGFRRLVRYIRLVERAMGQSTKRIQPGEWAAMEKLRGVEHGTAG